MRGRLHAGVGVQKYPTGRARGFRRIQSGLGRDRAWPATCQHDRYKKEPTRAYSPRLDRFSWILSKKNGSPGGRNRFPRRCFVLISILLIFFIAPEGGRQVGEGGRGRA